MKMYVVTTDPTRQLLRIEVSGFWSDDTMVAYRTELRRQASTLQEGGGLQRILVDMSDYPIQSTQIAREHAAALRFAGETLGARAAIVMRSALSKLQATRVATSSGHRFFTDDQDAISWLMKATS